MQPERYETEHFYNRYAARKSWSCGLLAGGLLASNVSQLKLLVSALNASLDKPKWYFALVLNASSIVLQIVVLILLGISANNRLTNKSKKTLLNNINNIVLLFAGFVFLISIISNIFIQVEYERMQTASYAIDATAGLFDASARQMPSAFSSLNANDWNIDFLQNSKLN